MSITQVWLTISGWMSQLGIIKRAHQFEARVQFLLGPARKVAVEPADTRRIGNHAVLALDPPGRAPFAEFAAQTSQEFRAVGSSTVACTRRKDLVKLRNAEVRQVDQASRVVNDQRRVGPAPPGSRRSRPGSPHRPRASFLHESACTRRLDKGTGKNNPEVTAAPVARRNRRRSSGTAMRPIWKVRISPDILVKERNQGVKLCADSCSGRPKAR